MDVYGTKEHVLYVKTNDDKTLTVSGEGVTDMFTVSRLDDSVTTLQGAKGEVQFNVNQKKLGQIVVNLLWGSTANKNLQQMLDDQQEGLYIKDIFLKRNLADGTSETIHGLKNGAGVDRVMVMKPADQGLNAEGAERPWTILIENLTWPAEAVT